MGTPGVVPMKLRGRGMQGRWIPPLISKDCDEMLSVTLESCWISGWGTLNRGGG